MCKGSTKKEPRGIEFINLGSCGVYFKNSDSNSLQIDSQLALTISEISGRDAMEKNGSEKKVG